MRNSLILVFVLALGAATLARPPEQTAEPTKDPWAGRTRADVVHLLGTPTKSKRSSRGETLTYKLVRLEDDAVTPVGVTVLNVPGVGFVGRMETRHGSLDDSSIAIEPSEMDRRGRRTGGGVGTEESRSVTWNKKEGKLERSWDERPSISGKLTLKFRIEAGRVVSWSVSPKKRVGS